MTTPNRTDIINSTVLCSPVSFCAPSPPWTAIFGVVSFFFFFFGVIYEYIIRLFNQGTITTYRTCTLVFSASFRLCFFSCLRIYNIHVFIYILVFSPFYTIIPGIIRQVSSPPPQPSPPRGSVVKQTALSARFGRTSLRELRASTTHLWGLLAPVLFFSFFLGGGHHLYFPLLNSYEVFPKRSSGPAVVAGVVPSPPRYVPSFLSRTGFSIPTARRFSSNKYC